MPLPGATFIAWTAGLHWLDVWIIWRGLYAVLRLGRSGVGAASKVRKPLLDGRLAGRAASLASAASTICARCAAAVTAAGDSAPCDNSSSSSSSRQQAGPANSSTLRVWHRPALLTGTTAAV